MRIGVLTGGGDCPGLNAVIRAVVQRAIRGHRWEVAGIRHGWRGLLVDEVEPLDLSKISGILPRGGTILGTSRTNPLKEPDGAVMLCLAGSLISAGLKQVVVSPHNLEQVVADARAPFDPAAYLQPRRERSRPVSGGDALQQIWCDVLGLEQIGVHERFSDLGGHSLLAMQIVAKIRSSYQISFTLRDFFDASTLAESRALIEDRVLAQVESLSEDEARALLSQS